MTEKTPQVGRIRQWWQSLSRAQQSGIWMVVCVAALVVGIGLGGLGWAGVGILAAVLFLWMFVETFGYLLKA